MKNHKSRKGRGFALAIALSLMLSAGNLSVAFAYDTLAESSGSLPMLTSSVAASEGVITPYGDLGYYTTKTLVQTVYKKMVFGGYLTNTWAQTEYYIVNETSSFTMTFGYSYEGANLSVSCAKEYSIASQIKADPTKWSKLAAFADFTIKKYLVKRYTTGGMLVDTYYTYTTTTTATYVGPKYQ